MSLTFLNNLGSGGVNAYVTGQDGEGRLVILQPDGTYFYPTADTVTPAPINSSINIPLNGISFAQSTADTAIAVDPSNITASSDLDSIMPNVNPAELTNVTVPDYLIACRIWLAVGELDFFTVQGANGLPSLVQPSAANPNDPSANVSWGFAELTLNDWGIFADITFVDFLGLPVGIILENEESGTQSAIGPEKGAVQNVCDDLAAQADVDGQPWDQLCVYDGDTGLPLRALAPPVFMGREPDAFSGYYDDYVDQVWSKYTNEPLTINTQTSAGNVDCYVNTSTNALSCAGDNREYAQPNSADIFGCNSGPFAIHQDDNNIHLAVVPRLCAAFNRGTLLLDGGNVQPGLPATSYYTSDGPNNWYSAIVHRHLADNKGYAFSYDDVVPNGGFDASGIVASTDPERLTIIVGEPTD